MGRIIIVHKKRGDGETETSRRRGVPSALRAMAATVRRKKQGARTSRDGYALGVSERPHGGCLGLIGVNRGRVENPNQNADKECARDRVAVRHALVLEAAFARVRT